MYVCVRVCVIYSRLDAEKFQCTVAMDSPPLPHDATQAHSTV